MSETAKQTVIRHCHTNAVLLESDLSLKEVVVEAVARGANLRGANLGGANLGGATTMPDGATWERYLSETVPALLTVAGKTLESFRDSWECHAWSNCPIAHAFDVHDLADVPLLYQPRANEFIQYFDAGLIPWSVIETALRERGVPIT